MPPTGKNDALLHLEEGHVNPVFFVQFWQGARPAKIAGTPGRRMQACGWASCIFICQDHHRSPVLKGSSSHLRMRYAIPR